MIKPEAFGADQERRKLQRNMGCMPTGQLCVLSGIFLRPPTFSRREFTIENHIKSSF